MNTNNDKPVADILFINPAKPIGEPVTYINASGKGYHSKPLMEIDIPEIRMFKMFNGEMKIINEDYWDTYDEIPQYREEIEREFEIKGTYITMEMHLKKASIRRLDEIQEELGVSFADIDYNVEDELADRLLSNNIAIEKIFQDHKRNVCNGEDGHAYAMVLQDRFWKDFGGRMKTLLRLKYKAIGFDPDVWCK
ncbi:hypothetical protein D5W64_12905 [Salmonella enterica subsp. enterica serovar Saintpaul]|nr:hypothetical protein [Salmonella enterica subsp. enterica serovar Saintpaul]